MKTKAFLALKQSMALKSETKNLCRSRLEELKVSINACIDHKFHSLAM